jgi:coenzyme F420-reducing hydrogenase delta subunit
MRNEPRIVAFCCEHSGWLAARTVSADEAALPDNVEIRSVPCSGSVQEIDILNALRSGADGVAVFGCHEDSCKHIVGNRRAKQRIDHVAEILKEIGWNPERVGYYPVAAVEGKVLRDRLAEVVDKLRGLTVEA